MDQFELFEEYLNVNRMYSFEGNKGVQHLVQIAQDVCGYKSLIDFLEDNPGSIEAIVDWICEYSSGEWTENLRSLVANNLDSEEE